MAERYQINEVFYSIQGEGIRAGTANVFVRFAACNLQCATDERFYRGEAYRAGFDCDTEFLSRYAMTPKELVSEMEQRGGSCRACVLTGGEPALQVDAELIRWLRENGWYVAIETNGTVELPPGIDWVCVSPKTAWHTLRQKTANELKLVRHAGQALPPVQLGLERIDNFLVSPAVNPDGSFGENLKWCIGLVKANPGWRLSVQQHKGWYVR